VPGSSEVLCLQVQRRGRDAYIYVIPNLVKVFFAGLLRGRLLFAPDDKFLATAARAQFSMSAAGGASRCAAGSAEDVCAANKLFGKPRSNSNDDGSTKILILVTFITQIITFSVSDALWP
jgi:hypothetical protein